MLKYISDSDRGIREACYSILATRRFHDLVSLRNQLRILNDSVMSYVMDVYFLNR